MSEPSEEEIARVEAVLMDDIKWAVRSGPGWNPMELVPIVDGSFVVRCAVCAIGAHVARNCLPAPAAEFGMGLVEDRYNRNVAAAALSLGIDKDWLDEVCGLVGMDDGELSRDENDEPTVDGNDIEWSAWLLSRRLRAFGDQETAAFHDSKATP